MPRVFSKKKRRRTSSLDDDENNKVVWSAPKVSSLSDRLLEKYRRKEKRKEREDEEDVDDPRSFSRRRRRLEIERESPKKLKNENDVFSRIHEIVTSKKKRKRKTKSKEIEMYRLPSRNATKNVDDRKTKQSNKRKASDRFETWGRSSRIRTRHKPVTTTTTTTTQSTLSKKGRSNPRKLSDVLRRLGGRDRKRSNDDKIDDEDSIVVKKKTLTTAEKKNQILERTVIVESSPSKSQLGSPSKKIIPAWKSKLANASMSTPQRSKQTPSPHRSKSASRKGKRTKQTPRGKALKQAMKHCGTGPISNCLKKVFRNLESDLSMFVHSCQKDDDNDKGSSSTFDMRQHRNNVELRVVNPCTARCKTHLICDCEVVRMTISSTSEKKSRTTFQQDAKISLIMKQNTLEKLCPSKECLSKDAIIRLYEPFHYFESENGVLSNLLLCTDLCEYSSN